MSSIGPSAGIFTALEVAGSGLSAERSRMNIIATNLANARTTRGADGLPYRRLDPVFQARPVDSSSFDPVLRTIETVELSRIDEDQTPGQLVYDPQHPDANEQGYVEMPNVNVVTEMVNMMTASRAYEAGVTSIESIKQMASAALRIGR
ncbi:MAG: flagellar basal body rod protein FlgC [Deltaproteobacteria bacterium]|nr:flagellar basal body rod protein FlgC [Deltaproteobacteria bacterium]